MRDVVTRTGAAVRRLPPRRGRESNLLAEGEPMPSGDEIGAQFEQFLAGLDDKPDGGEQ